MEKYYTPAIEDIHIGYECEFHGITTGGLYFFNDDGSKDEEKSIEPSIKVYYPMRCGIDPWSTDLKPEDIYESISNNQIRTPYLTKEQIEAEGWIFKTKSIDLWFESDIEKASSLQEFYRYKCYKLFLNYGLHDRRLIIKGDFTGGCNFEQSDTLFEGFCPSINEFRTICKLLNIK